jgi:tetratricopeptide (TPR) repeat protein
VSAAGRPAWWRRVSPPLAAAGVALAVFLPSLAGEFVYDDLSVIVANRHIRDLALIRTVLGYEPSRPLLNLSWALNYALGGLVPWHWHLVNVLVHAASAAIAASLFLWMAGRMGRPDARGVALFGAAFFAATPMAVETVAYVSSRSTALATLFALATLRVTAPALESGSVRRLVAGLGLFVLALATKEEAAAVPLLLLLIDAVVLARGRLRETAVRFRRHAPFFALLALGLLGRRLAAGAWLPPPDLDRGLYLWTQLVEFPGYLLRATIPLDPALFRGVPLAPWPPDAWAALRAFASLGLVAAALALLRRQPVFSLAVLWMLAALLPSSSLVPLRELVVDHRAYLGGAGVAFALAMALWRKRRGPALAALVVLLGAWSVHYERVIGDPVRAWSDAVRRSPTSPDAHRSLAEAYAARGDAARAEREFGAAARLDPKDARAAANYGTYLAGRGQYQEAVAAFRAAARAAPSDPRIRDNLGMLLLATGDADAARVEFEAAVRAKPALAQPRINLAALLIERGERARASALLDEALRLEIDQRDADEIARLRSKLQ